MENQIFEYFRELRKKEYEAIQLLLKLGYVIGDRATIDETVMLIKSRKINSYKGVDLIIKELNNRKEDENKEE